VTEIENNSEKVADFLKIFRGFSVHVSTQFLHKLYRILEKWDISTHKPYI